MADVKAVALQVVSALPSDAAFSDLDEFIYERAMVEDGRDDLAAGRARSPHEAAPEAVVGGADARVTWSAHATQAFLEALASSHSASTDEARTFSAAVVGAASSLVAANTGHSLPEMADPSIREIPVQTELIRYRLIYDVLAGQVRVLWFTSNITCYRNVRA